MLNARSRAGHSGIETGRTDIAGIFIPDLIKVDLSTESARLAGGGAGHPTNPDDPGFSRPEHLRRRRADEQDPGSFGGGVIPGGWPNGRRFGDDVVDIAVTALISDLRTSPPVIRGPAGDNVNANDWRSTRCSRTRRRRRTAAGTSITDVPRGTPCMSESRRPGGGGSRLCVCECDHAHNPGLSALDVRVSADRIRVSLSLAASDARQPAVGAIEAFAREAIVVALDGAPLPVRAARPSAASRESPSRSSSIACPACA